MLVSSFNLLQSFNYAPYLFCKIRFKSEINCFCIRTLSLLTWQLQIQPDCPPTIPYLYLYLTLPGTACMYTVVKHENTFLQRQESGWLQWKSSILDLRSCVFYLMWHEQIQMHPSIAKKYGKGGGRSFHLTHVSIASYDLCESAPE